MFCKLVLPSKEVHKLSSLPDTFEGLQDIINKRLSNQIPKNYQLKYQDSDNESITIANTEDLKAAFTTVEGDNHKTLRISIIPIQEVINNLKSNPKFEPLPGIPEAMEKSLSSLAEASRSASVVNGASRQVEEPLTSSFMKFDLDKIPRTQSLILDDEETVEDITACLDKSEDVSKDKKHFTFSGSNSIDVSKSQLDKTLVNGFFNEQKIKVIEDLIDMKITQTLQDRIQNIINQLVQKYQEECNFISPIRPSPYQSGFFPRTITRPAARRHTVQAPKGYSYKGPSCAVCTKVISGIKYFCLTCPDYACCEGCEETADHMHPLLKIRPAKKKEETDENTAPPELDDQLNLPDPGNPFFVTRSFGRRSTVSSRLMSMNSVINLPDITDQVDNYNNIVNGSSDFNQMASSGMAARRGFSMGSVFGGPPLQSKLGKTCSENDCRYKANITKQPAGDTINMKPGSSQNITLTIKNLGDSKWQDTVKLICINGIYKENELEVPNLKQSEEVTLTLPLIAPTHCGRYLSQWKLHYLEGGFPKQFGKAIFIDIEVNEKERQFDEEPLEEAEENEEREETHKNKSNKAAKEQEGSSIFEQKSQEPDKALMKEMHCCEEILNRAKTLNDMFPGDLKEKIEFIRSFPKTRSINDIVSSYLAKMSSGTKRRMTWTNNQRISTLS